MIRAILFWILLANTLLAQPPADSTEAQLASAREECKRLAQENDSLRQQLRDLAVKVDPPKSTSKIVEEFLIDGYGNPSCPACEKWWNGPEPIELRAAGWEVDHTPVARPQPGIFYPRWRVCVNDEPCVVIGYTKDFKGALQRYLDKRKR